MVGFLLTQGPPVSPQNTIHETPPRKFPMRPRLVMMGAASPNSALREAAAQRHVHRVTLDSKSWNTWQVMYADMHLLPSCWIVAATCF